MKPFDARTHMAVDCRSFAEIEGAEAVDLAVNQVRVRTRVLGGSDDVSVLTLPAGVRLVRRH